MNNEISIKDLADLLDDISEYLDFWSILDVVKHSDEYLNARKEGQGKETRYFLSQSEIEKYLIHFFGSEKSTDQREESLRRVCDYFKSEPEIETTASAAPTVPGGSQVVAAPEIYGFSDKSDNRAFQVEGRDGEDGGRIFAWLRKYTLIEAATLNRFRQFPVVFAEVELSTPDQYLADWTMIDDGTLAMACMKPMQFRQAHLRVVL